GGGGRSLARFMLASPSGASIMKRTPDPQVNSLPQGAPMNRWCLERYIPLLRVHVRLLNLSPAFRRRFDGSDLVAETMLRAHQGLGQFRGSSEGELLAWLRQILNNVAIDCVRRATAQKEDLRLERSIQASIADSSVRMEAALVDRGPPPGERLEREEQLLRVVTAIDQLPADQRDALLLRRLEGLPVAEVAARLGRTEKSVAGLLLRGQAALRKFLDPP